MNGKEIKHLKARQKNISLNVLLDINNFGRDVKQVIFADCNVTTAN